MRVKSTEYVNLAQADRQSQWAEQSVCVCVNINGATSLHKLNIIEMNKIQYGMNTMGPKIPNAWKE